MSGDGLDLVTEIDDGLDDDVLDDEAFDDEPIDDDDDDDEPRPSKKVLKKYLVQELRNIAFAFDVLSHGFTHTELARLFRLSLYEVRFRLRALTPVGERKDKAIYDVAQAAPFLILPPPPTNADIRRLVQTMAPADLPANLQRAFWDSQRTRQAFAKDAGQLWRTERVFEVLSRLTSIVRQRVVLATDTIDRNHPLTVDQRHFLQEILDGMMLDLQADIEKAFTDYDGSADRETAEQIERGIDDEAIDA